MSWVVWAVAGLVLLISELFVGAFYLVLIAAGCFVAAVLAYGGIGLPYSSWIAFSAGILAAFILLFMRSRHRATRHPASSNRDINPDIGGLIVVSEPVIGQASRVRYRGADWDALISDVSLDHQYRIVRVQGALLYLEPCIPGPAAPRSSSSLE